MNHLKVLEGLQLGDADLQKKSLSTKAAGKFYTPRSIAECVIARFLPDLRLQPGRAFRMIDPFCGDGRLIEWFLERAHDALRPMEVCIDVWDYEEAAVGIAHQRIRAAASRQSLNVTIKTHVGDSFRHAIDTFGAYDLVFTNPPWDRLKPDRRETEQLGDSSMRYVAALREQDDFIVARYPRSQPSLKFSGWGTNLARVGTEVALRLTKRGGCCAVISPASLFADQVSAQLRKWMFGEYRLASVDLFPAESKLFVGVDQPVAAFVAFADEGARVEPTLYQHVPGGDRVTSRVVEFDAETAERLDYRLPLNGGSPAERIFTKLSGLRRLGDLEGEAGNALWAGREIDETGFESYLSKRGTYRFIKGRLVDRYTMEPSPYGFVRKDGPRIPASSDYRRVVWRDVSRPTQERRLIATIAPPMTVAGNSLNVCYFRDDNYTRLKALLGIVNSFVFELQVRANLATAHVSLGAVRKAHVPDVYSKPLAKAIAALVDRCLAGDTAAKDRVEVAVAKAYGINRVEMRDVLAAFPRIDNLTVGRLTSPKLW